MLGAVLTPCNVYSGLKIGWSFNMSIAAALLSCGVWGGLRHVAGTKNVAHWGLLENNINQTCASSSASIISAGLVAPIPALTILTGKTLSWPVMSFWLFAVSCLGVIAGLALRRQMLEEQHLPFPSGVATAETVLEIYAKGTEATARIRYLLGAGIVAAVTKFFSASLPTLGPIIGLTWAGLPTVTTRTLGFMLDPSWLMIGFGAIVGFRVGWSLLLGAIVAWGITAPWLMATERIAAPASPDASIYGQAIEFLLWPGVAMMVSAALVSTAFSLQRMFRSLDVRKQVEDESPVEKSGELHDYIGPSREGIPANWMIAGFGIVMVLAVSAQILIFDIALPMAVLAVLLTFVLAVVAARVSGETGIPPIGALGKVTQLTFGLIHPTSVSVNLMTANVTGGAAGQCSDLLHDLKAGRLLGASVRAQAVAQILGVVVGSMVGSAAYLALVPNPAEMLLTEEWPAPAVATWKAVAELFRDGVDAAPSGAFMAALAGVVVGSLLAVFGHRLPARQAVWLPSPVSFGLAFVIPAFNSISLFLGATLALIATRVAPQWARRFVLPIAAGLVAGESLAGVGTAIIALFLGN